MLEVLFFFIAILPISYGNQVDNIVRNTSATIQPPSIIQQNNASKTLKLNVAGEGQAMLTNLTIQSLPKENQAFLMTSPADMNSNKVKARKGAPLEEIGNISIEQNPINIVDKVVNITDIKKNSTTETNSSASSPAPVTVPPKPLILSKELLNKADLTNSDPAPDEIDERKVNIRLHKTVASGHPGMITPIIITVLVVPIFAMIGYMALKRGKEAWKNRHYKRMDFLLDGMYND